MKRPDAAIEKMLAHFRGMGITDAKVAEDDAVNGVTFIESESQNLVTAVAWNPQGSPEAMDALVAYGKKFEARRAHA